VTEIDTTVPHSAWTWSYWLGGKDNYAVDWDAGDAYEIFPSRRPPQACSILFHADGNRDCSGG
jgi:hypothetical protein